MSNQFQIILVFLDDSSFPFRVSHLGQFSLKASLHLKVVFVPGDGCSLTLEHGLWLGAAFEASLHLEVVFMTHDVNAVAARQGGPNLSPALELAFNLPSINNDNDLHFLSFISYTSKAALK